METPWWAWLMFLLSVILSAFGSLPAFWTAEAKEVEKSILIGQSVLCRYCIVDVETDKILITGVKFKKLNDMQFNGTFFSRCRKVFEFTRYKTIAERTCLVIYWANSPVYRNNYTFRKVMPEGKNLRLR